MYGMNVTKWKINFKTAPCSGEEKDLPDAELLLAPGTDEAGEDCAEWDDLPELLIP